MKNGEQKAGPGGGEARLGGEMQSVDVVRRGGGVDIVVRVNY